MEGRHGRTYLEPGLDSSDLCTIYSCLMSVPNVLFFSIFLLLKLILLVFYSIYSNEHAQRTNQSCQNKSRMMQTTWIRERMVATRRCSQPRKVANVARTEAKCSVIVRAAGTEVRKSVGNSISNGPEKRMRRFSSPPRSLLNQGAKSLHAEPSLDRAISRLQSNFHTISENLDWVSGMHLCGRTRPFSSRLWLLPTGCLANCSTSKNGDKSHPGSQFTIPTDQSHG